MEAKETEENWDVLNDCIATFVTSLPQYVTVEGFNSMVKKLKSSILKPLMSERTKLARTAMTALDALSKHLGLDFEPFAEAALPVLLRLSARANKVYVTCSLQTLTVFVDTLNLSPYLSIFLESLRSASKSQRTVAMECIHRMVEFYLPEDLSVNVAVIESAIKLSILDQAPEVRNLAKNAFTHYNAKFPDRLTIFMDGLSDVGAKYLKLKPTGQSTARISIKSHMMNRHSVPNSSSSPKSVDDGKPSDTSARISPESATERRSIGSATKRRPASLQPSSSFVAGRTSETSSATPSEEGDAKKPSTSKPEKPRRPLSQPSSSASSRTRSAVVSITGSDAMQSPPTSPKAMRKPITIRSTNASPRRSASSTSTIAESEPSSPCSVLPAHPLPRKTVSRSSDEFSALSKDVKNPDWAKRLETLESLNGLIAKMTPDAQVTEGLKFAKVSEILMIGLGDSHNKCVSMAMRGLLSLVNISSTGEFFAAFVPKIAGLSFYQNAKAKNEVIQDGQAIMEAAKDKFGVEIICLAACNALHNPEYIKMLKVKAGCIGLIATFTADEWTTLSKKLANFKLTLTRLFAAASEPEVTVQKTLRTAISNAMAATPDIFWQVWSGLKQSDKLNGNILFGTKDLASWAKSPQKANASSKSGVSTPQRLFPASSPDINDSEIDTQSIKSDTPPRRLSETSYRPFARNHRRTVSLDQRLSASLEDVSVEGVKMLIDHPSSPREEQFNDGENPKGAPQATEITAPHSIQEVQDLFARKLGEEITSNRHALIAVDDMLSKIERAESEEAVYASTKRFHVRESSIPESTSLSKWENQSNLFLDAVNISNDRDSKDLNADEPVIEHIADTELDSIVDETPPELESPDKKSEDGGKRLSFRSLKSALRSPPPESQSIVEEERSHRRSKSVSWNDDVVTFGVSENGDADPPEENFSVDSYSMTIEAELDAPVDGVDSLWELKNSPVWESFLEARRLDILNTVLADLDQGSEKGARIIKHGLVILKSLIESFPDDCSLQLPRILDCTFQSTINAENMVEDKLEIDYEVDNVLEALEKSVPSQVLLKSITAVLEAPGCNCQRTCLEIMARVIDTSSLSHALLEEASHGNESSQDYVNSDHDGLISQIVDSLESRNPLTRKAAFDCAVSLCRKYGVAFQDHFFSSIEKKSGKERVIVIKGMVERRLQ
ncbi:hypothetical protein HDU76_006473 [Blyttiomyces sp. JEL0837]|nr:hypothetical protein HDU76_006473 [Blyttiomyces sp. JEL0837]